MLFIVQFKYTLFAHCSNLYIVLPSCYTQYVVFSATFVLTTSAAPSPVAPVRPCAGLRSAVLTAAGCHFVVLLEPVLSLPYRMQLCKQKSNSRLFRSDYAAYQGQNPHIFLSIFSPLCHALRWLYRGNLDSPVSFIVASDYNCERCVQFEKTLSKLYDNYKERVKFGFVHFADAPSLAALACEAAGEQKQFWTFHDTIFNYSGVADSAFIYNLAKSKRLNMTEFDAYLHSSDKYKEMDKVINQLVERGLMATPTIIINDRLVYVTNSYEELSRLLEYEL